MIKRVTAVLTAFAVTAAGLWVPQAAYAASKVKISSAGDLKKMEDDPYGDYYLAKDITVPKNTCLFADGTPFSGTLDGRGHKLKNYKSTQSQAIFASAEYATFKNLSVVNVDIKSADSVAALVYDARSCLFNGVSVSGKITYSGGGGTVAGIAALGTGELSKCKSSVKITVRTDSRGITAGGLVGDFTASSLKNCTNTGAISVTSKKETCKDFSGDPDYGTFVVAGVSAGSTDAVTSCKNTGNITLKTNHTLGDDDYYVRIHGYFEVNVAGVCNNAAQSIKSSGNTGKIAVTTLKKGMIPGGKIAGVVCNAVHNVDDPAKASRCYNTGAISVKTSAVTDTPIYIGGVVGSIIGEGVTESYNKGAIKASLYNNQAGEGHIGGVAGYVSLYTKIGKFTNNYNAGALTVTCNGGNRAGINAGGVAGCLQHYVPVTSLYNTGKMKFSGGMRHGELLGTYDGPFVVGKRLCYDNYYTGSTVPYGSGDTSWKPYQPTAKKVSSITSGNCPKLSSKYWTYSSKYKRLILKNNQEK